MTSFLAVHSYKANQVTREDEVIYTHREVDTDGSTQWTKTQSWKNGGNAFSLVRKYMWSTHLLYLSILTNRTVLVFISFLVFFIFFILIFRTRKHEGTQKYKSSDRCKMQHGSGPALILCSLMYTQTQTHTHTHKKSACCVLGRLIGSLSPSMQIILFRSSGV